jgi:hypothetical protein
MRQLLAICLCFSFCLLACDPAEVIKPDPPAGTFVYGTEGREIGTDILELPDGDLLVLGATTGEKDEDYEMQIIRIRPDGSEVGTWTYANPGVDDYPGGIIALSSGYLVAGFTGNVNTQTQIFLRRLDSDFNLVDETSLPFAGYTSDKLYLGGMFEKENGGFLVAVKSSSAKFLFDFSDDLVQNSIQQFESPGYNEMGGEFFVKVADGYVMAYSASDYTSSNTRISAVVQHFDANGAPDYAQTVEFYDAYALDLGQLIVHSTGRLAMLYSENYSPSKIRIMDSTGVPESDVDPGLGAVMYYLVELPGGELALGGNERDSRSGPGRNRTILSIVDGSGDLASTSVFGEDQPESCRGIFYRSDGTIMLTGSSASYGSGSTDCYVILYNR